MQKSWWMVLVLSLGFVACSGSTTAAPHPAITCTVEQATSAQQGYALYPFTCQVQPPAHTTAFHVTATSPTLFLANTWCEQQPVALHGPTSCHGSISVTAGEVLTNLTFTATFFPSNHQVSTPRAIPIPHP